MYFGSVNLLGPCNAHRFLLLPSKSMLYNVMMWMSGYQVRNRRMTLLMVLVFQQTVGDQPSGPGQCLEAPVAHSYTLSLQGILQGRNIPILNPEQLHTHMHPYISRKPIVNRALLNQIKISTSAVRILFKKSHWETPLWHQWPTKKKIKNNISHCCPN